MPRPAPLQITQATQGTAVVVAVEGELDLSSVETLAKHLADHVGGNTVNLTLDLRELRFMDSSGLKFLIDLHDRAQGEQWQLELLAPRHESAALVLRATGADRALPFVANPL